MVGFRDAIGWEAIVGQTDLKQALEVVAVQDDLGLLIDGETGTAKSTAVRALAERLPEQRAIADCPYGCPPAAPTAQCEACRERTDPPVETRRVPVVTVPLGATRDRVTGSLAVGDALDGEASFDPGLLARANRGILYVDEVNLLDDHLVDLLLDAAASGVNRVERDGLSVTHPADFTLVGTMNPEEGQLRPQLRDRFALTVSVSGSDDPDERVQIIDAALGATETGDVATGESTADDLTDIGAARDRIDDVRLPEACKRRIATVCADSGVDGHRADVAAARAAIARAALAERTTVREADVEWALERALAHRLRGDPFERSRSASSEDPLDSERRDARDEHSDERGSEGGDDTGGRDSDRQREDGGAPKNGQSPDTATATDPGGEESVRRDEQNRAIGGDLARSDPDDESADRSTDAPVPDGRDGASEVHTAARPAASVDRPAIEVPEAGPSDADGDRSVPSSATGEGPRVRTEPADPDDDIDAAATARAAARTGGVDRTSLRRSVDRDDAPALVAIGIDASASMGPAIEHTKAVATATLRDAYADRDRIAVVEMSGDRASVCVPPTDSVSVAARYLAGLSPGDRSPLVDGCATLADVLSDADAGAAVAVVVTDGHPTVADRPLAALDEAAGRLGAVADRTIVVAAGDGPGIDRIERATDGSQIDLGELTADRIGRATAEERD